MTTGFNLPPGCTDADVDRAAPQSTICDLCDERLAEVDGLCERCAIDEAAEILKGVIADLDRAKALASCRSRADISSARYHAWSALVAEERVLHEFDTERGAA